MGDRFNFIYSMPDFERLTDSLMVDLCHSEQDKKAAKAYIKGKSYARKEIVYVVLCLATIYILVQLWLK